MSKPDKPEAPEPAPPTPTPEDIKALEAKAKLSQEYYDQLLRLKAEFENFRKRADREKPDLVRFGRADVLSKLLPLYDVLAHAHAEIQKADSDSPLAKGMELIFKEFEKLFASEGVKAIEAAGKPYSHELHDVMGTVEKADVPDGTVVEVLQQGFTLEGKVLRHAKVRISKKPPEGG